MTPSSQASTPPPAAPRAWLPNLILLGITSLICIGALEAVGQWRRPALPPRALFFNENPWQYDARGFLTFRPSRTLRSAAAYGGELEYDITFRTNKAGFVDDHEYGTQGGTARRIAIVGDSFTAGFHGGRAWVPRLREAPGFDPRRHTLFNFGVSGTGFPNFRGILAALVPALGIDEILIVAIANDFERPLIRAPSTSDGVVLCNVEWSEERCLSQKTQIFTISHDATPQAVLARAQETFAAFSITDREFGALEQELKEVRQDPAQRGTLLNRIRHQSYLVHVVRQLISATPPPPDYGTLAEIRRAHPEAQLAVLQLPEKADVLNESFESLRGEIEAAGATYHDGASLCGLTATDFLPNDSHPNASGYAKVRDCVQRILAF